MWTTQQQIAASGLQQINTIERNFNVLRLWCRLKSDFQKISGGPYAIFQNDLAQLVMN
jgi:hypothetical protein